MGHTHQRRTVYTELRRLAGRYLAGERYGHTLQPTALVHEAYLRLRSDRLFPGPDRQTLVAVAARAMRLTLVDYARRHKARKRSCGGSRLPLEKTVTAYQQRSRDLVELDEALARLAKLDPQLAQIVELRFFGRMTTEEIAETLRVSRSTVVRGWRFSRMWLYTELTRRHS